METQPFPQVPREAAEEAKEAVAAPTAAAVAGGDGLDMFADNVDADMFAEDPGAPVGIAPAKKALLDNYDDVEGYYNFQVAVCVASCVGLLCLQHQVHRLCCKSVLY